MIPGLLLGCGVKHGVSGRCTQAPGMQWALVTLSLLLGPHCGPVWESQKAFGYCMSQMCFLFSLNPSFLGAGPDLALESA